MNLRDQGREGGRIVPVTWHTSYGTPVQLTAGARRAELRELQRAAVLGLVRRLMLSDRPAPVRHRWKE